MDPAEGAASDPFEDFRAMLRELPDDELDSLTADAPGFNFPEGDLDLAPLPLPELPGADAEEYARPLPEAELIALERKRRRDRKLARHAAYLVALEDEV